MRSELSGTGATSGINFNDGVKLAVKEINASGGILGRKIEYSASDTQSQPQIAKALAVKANDDGAYVVMGPVLSGSILVSMAETRRAEVPNFTGGEAAGITQQGNPYIFRTSFTQSSTMPKVARYLNDNLKAKRRRRWPSSSPATTSARATWFPSSLLELGATRRAFRIPPLVASCCGTRRASCSGLSIQSARSSSGCRPVRVT